MLVNPNLVITTGPVPHNLEASIVPALQALWGCVVRGMWTSAWTGPATPQAQLPATLWPMPFIASVCLDTQASGVKWRSTPARASPAPTEGPVKAQQDHPQVSPAAAPRVLKAPPATKEPLPVAPITATMVASACLLPNQVSSPAVLASMAMRALTA